MPIKLEFLYLEILEVNDKDFSITLRVDIAGRWEEPRIIPPPGATQNKVETPLDTSLLKHLWIMNLFVYNLKEIKKFKVLSPSKNSIGFVNLFFFILRIKLKMIKG